MHRKDTSPYRLIMPQEVAGPQRASPSQLPRREARLSERLDQALFPARPGTPHPCPLQIRKQRLPSGNRRELGSAQTTRLGCSSWGAGGGWHSWSPSRRCLVQESHWPTGRGSWGGWGCQSHWEREDVQGWVLLPTYWGPREQTPLCLN